jgi:hypothetical protein
MRSRNRNYKIVPGAEPAIDALKYTIAKNLGLSELIDKYGWTRLTTMDAGNVGGAIQQVINELGQKELLKHFKDGTIETIAHLSSDAQPEHTDLTRNRLINEIDPQGADFQKLYNTRPGVPLVDPIRPNRPTLAQ